MKDITITRKRIKTELYVFLGCVVAMELVNAYAIADKNGQWSELFMSLGYVCVAAAVTYVVLAVIRLVIGAIWHKTKGKNRRRNRY